MLTMNRSSNDANTPIEIMKKVRQGFVSTSVYSHSRLLMKRNVSQVSSVTQLIADTLL